MKKRLDFKHFLSRKTGVQLFGSSDRLYSRFLFIFVIIRLFRFRYTFYHVNDYGIKLCGVLRCNDRTPGILFDILPNLTGIAAATTGNLLTFRKSFRLMCF